jgi:hypothetical protein
VIEVECDADPDELARGGGYMRPTIVALLQCLGDRNKQVQNRAVGAIKDFADAAEVRTRCPLQFPCLLF